MRSCSAAGQSEMICNDALCEDSCLKLLNAGTTTRLQDLTWTQSAVSLDPASQHCFAINLAQSALSDDTAVPWRSKQLSHGWICRCLPKPFWELPNQCRLPKYGNPPPKKK
eukprot:2624982-Rhodomonas_salina.2